MDEQREEKEGKKAGAVRARIRERGGSEGAVDSIAVTGINTSIHTGIIWVVKQRNAVDIT